MSSPSRTGLYKIDFFLTLPQHGATALHAASQEGHYQVAELLLQAGASVEPETKVRCGVGQDCVCDTEQCTYTIKLPCILLLGVKAWERVFTQTFDLSLAYCRHSNYI